MNNSCRLVALLVASAWAVGCSDRADTTDVSGTVSVSGQPMGVGAINFYPDGEARPIGFPVDESGSYSAQLPPGKYSVVIVTSTPVPEGWEEGDPLPAPAVEIPSKYQQPRFTPLELSVGADDVEHDFNLD